MRLDVRRSTLLLVILSCGALAAPGCSTTMTGPSAKGPVVNSITPDSGPTLGGTSVTILGGGFLTGTTVTIGGVSATDVRITGTTTLTAITPQHAAGAVDVVVSAGGGSTTLAGAFTFLAPSVTPNAPPTIGSLTARGARPNEPAQFADKGETIAVTATVTDPETPIANLTFAWTSEGGGTFAGTGPAVTWTAPASVTAPLTVTLTLTVTETYDTVGPSGLPTKGEHKVTKTVAVSVHDTVKEVGGMAVQFLEDFSDSTIANASYILRNFADSCAGKAAENEDIVNNRARVVIQSHDIGAPVVSTGFGAGCPVHHVRGDACAQVPVKWVSRVIATGDLETAEGTDQVSAVYLTAEQKWALCGSDWDPSNGLTEAMKRFMR